MSRDYKNNPKSHHGKVYFFPCNLPVRKRMVIDHPSKMSLVSQSTDEWVSFTCFFVVPETTRR